MYLMDTSGSMDWTFMPDNVGFYEAAADALEAREGVAHTSV